MKAFTKDPSDVLDYTRNAAKFLNGDTISSSTWTTESGLTIDSQSNNTTSTTVWLSGGQNNCDYTVTNKIVTTAGRTKELSFKLQVRDQ